MTRITLDIIENKLDFFMELIENLEFVKVSSEYKVPMEQQDIVMERLDDITKNPKNLLAWDDVKEDI
ncbi:MAG: hypothetical protein HN778_11555 [Prolixibacteraceae bacterium]|nr:hypothetical protein [Prolixibacteraceae bacterium]MBT6005251.1 hypothetical protein [Prolixibacteraceae bacterium]MBT6763769.1 hypothetical protein [Prolixibacteraceae bacterium]MBT6996861.1 hypothetical protein [Prolixibacteraceae bacterium]MBT7395460.1 hypothetical protein [Prolixibacteraceae bacterium]